MSRALADLVATIDAGGLDALDDRQLVEFLHTLETVQDEMSLVGDRTLSEARSRDLA